MLLETSKIIEHSFVQAIRKEHNGPHFAAILSKTQFICHNGDLVTLEEDKEVTIQSNGEHPGSGVVYNHATSIGLLFMREKEDEKRVKFIIEFKIEKDKNWNFRRIVLRNIDYYG